MTRQNRWNCSTGVIEVNYPMTMTVEDIQDFKDQMAITFRILERTAINGQPADEREATGEELIAREDAARQANAGSVR